MANEMADFLATLRRGIRRDGISSSSDRSPKSVCRSSKKPQVPQGEIMERIVEPERVIMFRHVGGPQHECRSTALPRADDSAIGPYKAGCGFNHSVTLGTLKFLAFEQVFRTL